MLRLRARDIPCEWMRINSTPHSGSVRLRLVLTNLVLTSGFIFLIDLIGSILLGTFLKLSMEKHLHFLSMYSMYLLRCLRIVKLNFLFERSLCRMQEIEQVKFYMGLRNSLM